MTMNGMGSRRAAESAVEMALAMVDAYKLTVVRPSFGVDSTGRRPPSQGLRRHEDPSDPSGKGQPKYILTLVSSKRLE